MFLIESSNYIKKHRRHSFFILVQNPQNFTKTINCNFRWKKKEVNPRPQNINCTLVP